MYLSVAILRVPKGLDYSQVLGEESVAQKNILELSRNPHNNESSVDLNYVERNTRALSGSIDSLSRNVSQGKCWTSAHTQIACLVLNRGMGSHKCT